MSGKGGKKRERESNQVFRARRERRKVSRQRREDGPKGE